MHPPIRLIAFDVDGTLVDETVYIWETLHGHFGCDPDARRQARDDYLAGRISYQQWFEHDLVLLRGQGADRSGIAQAISALRPASGAIETLQTLRQRGYRLGVISGSIDLVLGHCFDDFSFDHVLINRLSFADDGRLEGGAHTPYDMAAKAEGLAELARREDLQLQQCAFVGDNRNDLEALRAAGFSVAVHAQHPDVVAAASVVVEGDDLRPLLDHFPPLD